MKRKPAKSAGNASDPFEAAGQRSWRRTRQILEAQKPREDCETFPVDDEHISRRASVLDDPDCPMAAIDHQGFGQEVSLLTDLETILFGCLEDLLYEQRVKSDDPRTIGWQPILGDDPQSQLAWELIRYAIELEVIPFGRGMFSQGVLWAADKTAAEVQAAASMIRAQRKAAAEKTRNAIEARLKKHEPKRKDIRRRFRELRKQGFNKKMAREELQRETGKSVRQLERDTKGLS